MSLPPGRTKQDVANLLDLALSDSLVDGDRYDYDILVEKLRGNGLALVALTSSPSIGDLSSAAGAVLAERRRQIETEGWTAEHDDAEHGNGTLASAAACYAVGRNDLCTPTRKSIWPWDAQWWKPKDRRRDLVRSGALILAEIERLDRANKQDAGVAGPPTERSVVTPSSSPSIPGEGEVDDESILPPCPFCGCDLEHMTLMPGGNILRHPWHDGECVLGGFEFPVERAPNWRCRATPQSSGRDAALEEAAQVADAHKAEMDRIYQVHIARGDQAAADRVAARSNAAAAIASEIRALKSPSPPEGGERGRG